MMPGQGRSPSPTATQHGGQRRPAAAGCNAVICISSEAKNGQRLPGMPAKSQAPVNASANWPAKRGPTQCLSESRGMVVDDETLSMQG